MLLVTRLLSVLLESFTICILVELLYEKALTASTASGEFMAVKIKKNIAKNIFKNGGELSKDSDWTGFRCKGL